MMTPEKFNKIVNKLPKEKIALNKIELSIATDIQKVLKTTESLDDKGYKAEERVEKALDKFYDAQAKVQESGEKEEKILSEIEVIQKQSKELIASAESAAKELGISPGDIDSYFDLKDKQSNLNQTYNRLVEIIKTAKKQ